MTPKPTIGLVADANYYWQDTTLFAADCRRWRTNLGITHAMLMSGSVERIKLFYPAARANGIKLVHGAMEELVPFLSGAGPDTQEEADRLVGPVAALMGANFDVVDGVLVDDDTSIDDPARISRIKKVVAAYRRLLPGMPVTATLVWTDLGAPVQREVGFDRYTIQVYPCTAASTPGAPLMQQGEPIGTHVRQMQAAAGEPKDGPHAPLWVVGQGHSGVGGSLRKPTPEEIKAQYDNAWACGAERFYLFGWDSQAVRDQNGVTIDFNYYGLNGSPTLRRAVAELDGHWGVPHLDPDYGLSVEQWWAGHPFNIESPNYRPKIKVPEEAYEIDVDLHGGNLGAAVEAARSAVGYLGHTVLWLGDGPYDLSTIHPVGFTGLAKSNVQLRKKRGASPRLTRTLRLLPCDDARAYHSGTTIGGKTYTEGWAQKLGFNSLTSVDDPQDPGRKLRAHEVALTYPCRGWYIEDGIVMDAAGLTQSISKTTCRDMVFDASVYQGVLGTSGHIGSLTGNLLITNVWARGSWFRGNYGLPEGTPENRDPIYWDGAHGCGVIDCSFDQGESIHDILLLVNEDATRDYSGDGTYSQMLEQRKANYFVSADNDSGGEHAHLAVMGSNWLVLRADRYGTAPSWAFVSADMKDNPRVPYVYTGGVIRDCYVESMGAQALLREIASSTTNPGVIGQHTVRGNVVNDPGFARWVSAEGNVAGHVGPNVVEDNTTIGFPKPAEWWSPSQVPYLEPTAPPPAEDCTEHEATIAALEAQVANLIIERDQAQATVITLAEQVGTLSVQVTSLATERDQLQSDLDAALGEIGALLAERDQLAGTLASAREHWFGLQAALDH